MDRKDDDTANPSTPVLPAPEKSAAAGGGDDDDDQQVEEDDDELASDDSEQDDNDDDDDPNEASRRPRSGRRGRRGIMDNSLLSYDDPYTYSDDSASLSDAYFFPTDDELALPPRYRSEKDPLQFKSLALPVPTDYGSVPRKKAGAGGDRAGAAGARHILSHITEDAPDTTPETAAAAHPTLPQPHGTVPTVPGEQWRTRRQRKEAQRRRIRQMKQMAREREVAQIRGTPQDPTVWRDPAFAVLFVLQLALVLACARVAGLASVQLPSLTVPLDGRFHWQHGGGDAAYSDDPSQVSADNPAAHDEATTSSFTLDDVVTLVAFTGFYSFVLSFVSFCCMLVLARTLLQVLLSFSILLSLAWAFVGLSLDPYGTISVLGFLSILLTLAFTILNWSRIRFASTNLFTALCGIRCTADMIILGLSGQVVVFAWCVVWSASFIGALTFLARVDCGQEEVCAPPFRWDHLLLVCLPFGFSFLWTCAVIKNVVQAAVAGACGTWWCHPQEVRPFCTSAVSHPLLRAVTTSFGSVCLASLVVNPAQFLITIGGIFCCAVERREAARRLARSGRSPQQSNGLGARLGRVGEKIGRGLRSCNRWTFTYIGLYGYDFREAGERALQLFETREWLDVVQDELVPNVLSMASFVIGGSSGTAAVVFRDAGATTSATSQIPTYAVFFTGIVVGYVISTCLLLGLVGSSVNTVLVCFASHPFEFDVNHPRLSKGLRDVWSHQVWDSRA